MLTMEAQVLYTRSKRISTAAQFSRPLLSLARDTAHSPCPEQSSSFTGRLLPNTLPGASESVKSEKGVHVRMWRPPKAHMRLVVATHNYPPKSSMLFGDAAAFDDFVFREGDGLGFDPPDRAFAAYFL